FTTGTTGIQAPNQTAQYRLIGSARVNREIGRTWHATATFNRNVGFVEGFQQPFFADSLAANVGGTLNRRVELLLGGGYSKGQLGVSLSALGSETDNYNSSAILRIALSHS